MVIDGVQIVWFFAVGVVFLIFAYVMVEDFVRWVKIKVAEHKVKKEWQAIVNEVEEFRNESE